MSSQKVLILCNSCGAKNRVDTSLRDKVVRCGKCGEKLSLDIDESLAPAIQRLRDVAGKIKMEFEAYTRYKVCSVIVDLVEDTLHIRWKVETNIEDLWRLKQRWPVSYYYTLKMLLAVYDNAPDSLSTIGISFFERYMNFSPEDEGDTFRDLCLLSIKGDRKSIIELKELFDNEDALSLTGPQRQRAMENLQDTASKILSVRQNYRGTLINKSSLIYKAVKPFDLQQDSEIKVEEVYKEDMDKTEDKKVAAMRLIEENIEKINTLDTQYIRVFAKKYGLGNEERRASLKELLVSKNIKLPDKVIYRLIQKELDDIEYDRFVKRIRTDERLSLNHYIRRFLELFPDWEERVQNFYRYLTENKIIIEDVSTNADKLKVTIDKIQKSIALEQFEKNLVEETEVTIAQPSGEIDISQTIDKVDPLSESYQFFGQTLSQGKPGGIPGIIRLYVDNFMDNPNNRAMLLYLLIEEKLISDPEEIDINNEITKIQYEDIPEPLEEKLESFDSYSSQEILEHFSEFDFSKSLHLMRYLFERMGFNARIVDKEEEKSGIIFLHNQDDEKLIVKYFHNASSIEKKSLSDVTALVESFHADYGICVSKGQFEQDALQFALENDIEIIDKSKVERLIANVL